MGSQTQPYMCGGGGVQAVGAGDGWSTTRLPPKLQPFSLILHLHIFTLPHTHKHTHMIWKSCLLSLVQFALPLSLSLLHSLTLTPSHMQGGCIIRAGFLDRIKQAYRRDEALPNLLVDPGGCVLLCVIPLLLWQVCCCING